MTYRPDVTTLPTAAPNNGAAIAMKAMATHLRQRATVNSDNVVDLAPLMKAA